MYLQDLITDGILNGEVPLLQTYLQNKNGQQPADLRIVVEFGLQRALQYLQERQLLMAGQIFANLVSTNSFLCI